jgi:hypothetical protein
MTFKSPMTKALATLTNDRVSVSLEFRFGASGEVTGIYTPARWGTFAGGYKQVPWEGHFRDYRERDGNHGADVRRGWLVHRGRMARRLEGHRGGVSDSASWMTRSRYYSQLNRCAATITRIKSACDQPEACLWQSRRR